MSLFKLRHSDLSQKDVDLLMLKVGSAIRRCTDPKHKQYADYGGRGIKVYAPWIASPCSFAEYLLTLSGHDDNSLYLDREDNDGNYEPGNLRFVTPSVSRNNQRNLERKPR